MPARRPVASTEAIDRIPIGSGEIDLALSYADQMYTVELNPDLTRIVFNTVQKRREPGMDLHDLTCVVVDELVRESRDKRDAMLGAVMKVYSQRSHFVRSLRRARTAKKSDLRAPFDADMHGQRLLFAPREKV